ncbi:MAG: cellulase family glycosylhydrolase [Anaerolineae bacterium]|nr:cellulase family glycosylhydrolase [Anaerolineae bacterium]
MSGLSSGKGVGGNQLYIAIAVWLALVLVGSTCLYIGYTINPSDSGSKQAAITPTSAVIPTATGVPVVRPTFAPYPTVESAEEVFGYGIAIHGTGGPLELMDYWMGQVDSLGLGWVKQQVRWGFFEGNPGEMDWSGYDAVVDSANKANLKVMLSVVEAPVWTRTYFDDNPEKAPPDDLAKYAEFLGRLVDRYKGRIHAIEVWNEQNLDREWDTAEGVSAERYVEMLRLSYQAIKSRDPNIIVISGALAPTGANLYDKLNPERRITMDDFEYFDQMIAAGFLNYCDCVGAHHNGYNLPPDAGQDDGYSDPAAQFASPFTNPHHSWWFKTTLWGYHDRIQAAGSDKPLCVTEFGWASTEGFDGYPEKYPEGFGFAVDNTQEEQAQWIVQGFKLMREWGFVRMAFLWNLNFSQLNDGRGAEDSNAPYGIIDLRGAPRPAFEALAAMEKP